MQTIKYMFLVLICLISHGFCQILPSPLQPFNPYKNQKLSDILNPASPSQVCLGHFVEQSIYKLALTIFVFQKYRFTSLQVQQLQQQTNYNIYYDLPTLKGFVKGKCINQSIQIINSTFQALLSSWASSSVPAKKQLQIGFRVANYRQKCLAQTIQVGISRIIILKARSSAFSKLYYQQNLQGISYRAIYEEPHLQSNYTATCSVSAALAQATFRSINPKII